MLPRLKRLAASPAIPAYGLKGLNAVTAFAATALLARMAGAEVVGNYAFSVVTATILAIIALHGLDIIMLREAAGDLRQGHSGAARGALRFAIRSVAVTTAVITALFVAINWGGRPAAALATDPTAFLAGAIGIGAAAFYRLGLGGLRAAGRPVAGQFFEGANSLLFAGIIAGLWIMGQGITALGAVLLFFGCQLLSMAASWVVVRRDARSWDAPTPPDKAKMRVAGLPIMATSGLQMFQDWLLFALVAGAASAAAVGALRVALQIIMVISMVVITGENLIAAKVAGDLRQGRPDLVWRRHRRATLAMAAVIGPMLLVCIVFPNQLMGLAFGSEFVIAGPALAIMAAGQASKLATGPIGGLLMMSGHERWLLGFTLVALALLVGLALWLVPVMGLEGAAIAHAAATTFRNVAGYAAAWKFIPKRAG